jgi:hypothetical protein
VRDRDCAAEPRRILRDLEPGPGSPSTLATEKAAELPRSVYFYVGYASPSFGDVVFVYGPKVTDDKEWSASAFDTGGVFHKHINYDHVRCEKNPADYIRKRTIHCPGDWRTPFDAFLRSCFPAGPAGYVRGDRPGPNCPDDCGRLALNNKNRRAWTWEIRIHSKVPLKDKHLVAVWIAAEYRAHLEEFLGELDDQTRRAWIKFFQDYVRYEAADRLHSELEKEIVRCLSKP